MSLDYWSPKTREALHQGRVSIDQEELLRQFREWRNEDVFLHFQHEDGDTIDVLGAKRGNGPYARKKKRKRRELDDGMNGLVWDHDIQGSRKDVIRKTHLIFITLTFDRTRSCEESWRLLTSKGQALNEFSAKLYKIVGNKATFKAKEASSSGYPAPHILCIMDRPVTARRYKDKWIVQSRELQQQIKAAWPYGHADVEACVNGKMASRPVMSYMMKYMTKSVDVDPYQPKQANIAELTHAWQKVYGMRDVISKQFMQRLNLHQLPPLEEAAPSGWELANIEISPDMILFAQRTGWGVMRPSTELMFAG